MPRCANRPDWLMRLLFDLANARNQSENCRDLLASCGLLCRRLRRCAANGTLCLAARQFLNWTRRGLARLLSRGTGSYGLLVVIVTSTGMCLGLRRSHRFHVACPLPVSTLVQQLQGRSGPILTGTKSSAFARATSLGPTSARRSRCVRRSWRE